MDLGYYATATIETEYDQAQNEKQKRAFFLLFITAFHARKSNGNDHQYKTDQAKIRKFFVEIDQSEEVGKHHAAQHQEHGINGHTAHGNDLEADEGVCAAKQNQQRCHEQRKGRYFKAEAVYHTVDNKKNRGGEGTRDDIEDYADTHACACVVLVQLGQAEIGRKTDDGKENEKIILHSHTS